MVNFVDLIRLKVVAPCGQAIAAIQVGVVLEFKYLISRNGLHNCHDKVLFVVSY
jgi:hypothetical protein